MIETYPLILSDGQPHEYQIKLSKRAKRLRINLSNTGNLSVTLPHRINVVKAHTFVKSKRSWIEKHLSKLPAKAINKIPESLNFELLNETWLIETVFIDSNKLTLEIENDYRLVITGDIHNIDLVKKLINQWCRNKSRVVFTSMMETLAEEHGFHFNRLSFRSQKTRWGSCSGNKNISLNSKLLFMSEAVVKYVMIHELCHTVEMNHSSRFWSLVEDCDPEYRHHKKQLKEYGKSVLI